MGFYGNISNNRATFQFDKVYHNRKEMDENCTKDGVFVGRYVLVDYNDDTNVNFINAYKIIDSTGECHFHTALDATKATRIEYAEGEVLKTGQVKSGQLLKVLGSATYQQAEFEKIYSITYNGPDLEQVDVQLYENPEIWRCDGYEVPEEVTVNADIESKIAAITNFISEWETKSSDEEYKQYYLDNINGILTIPQNITYPDYITTFLTAWSTKNEAVAENEELILDPDWQDEMHYHYNVLMNQWANSADTALYAHFTQEFDLQKSSYQTNFSIDSTTYPAIGRGWDSTIWQKISRINNTTEGREEEVKYIMVAELNTLTPTFDITYEAPTETPLVPYYDTKDTSNLYYNLHMQPQWGMRIKNQYSLDFSIDTKVYPSDVSGPFVIDSQLRDSTRTFSVFEKVSENGQIKFRRKDNVSRNEILPVGNRVINDQYNSPLAIYFNKAGFDKYKQSNAIVDVEEIQNANSNIIKDQNGNLIDSIMMRPTGLSANSYYNWAKAGETPANELKQPDTYELSIMLPSIGQTFSEIWDLIYGEGSTYDAKGYLLFHPITKTFAGATESSKLRNTDISWNSDRGIRAWDVTSNLVTENLNTLAGVINSTHDLMGMIIRDYDGLTIDNNAVKQESNDSDPIKPKDWDPGKIYYVGGKYYIKSKKYVYTPWTSSSSQYRLIPQEKMIDINNNGDIELYKEEWQEYSSDYTQRAKQRYIDYYRLHDYSEYMEGAKYVKKVSASSENPQELNFKYTKGTYYYATNGETNTATDYIIDNNDAPTLERHYYYIASDTTESAPVDVDHTSVCEQYSKIFYIPGMFYVYYDNMLKLSDQITLQAVYEDLGISTSDINNVKFYQVDDLEKISNEDETEISYIRTEKEGYKISVSYLPDHEYTLNGETISRKCYQVFNGKYYFVEPNEQNNELVQIKNGEILSIDTDAGTYTTYKYAVQGSERYYTPWEIYINQLVYSTINNDYIKEKDYEWTKIEKQSERWVIKNKDKYIPASNVVDFKNDPSLDSKYNNRFFYLLENKTFKELTRDQLYSNKARWANNMAHEYYVIDFKELPYFYTVEDPDPVHNDITYCYLEGDNYCAEITPNIPSWGEHKTYYKITDLFQNLNSDEEIYRPNYFYIKDENNNYILSTSYEPNVDYYEKIGPYVMQAETSANVIMDEVQEGTEWRGNIDNVINSYVQKDGSNVVRIGTRTATWEAKELKQYGKELNTINGLILKLNQLMFEDNKNSIEGAIKRVYDTIANFEMIAPYSFNQVKAEDGNSVNVIGSSNTELSVLGDDQWIKTEIKNNKLIIKHKKINAQSSNTNIEEFLDFGGKIPVPVITCDEVGHVVGVDNKPFNLPNIAFNCETLDKTNSAELDFIDSDSNVSMSNIKPSQVMINAYITNDGSEESQKIKNINFVRSNVNELIWKTETKENQTINKTIGDTFENNNTEITKLKCLKINAPKFGYIQFQPSTGKWRPMSNNLEFNGDLIGDGWTQQETSDYFYVDLKGNDIKDSNSIVKENFNAIIDSGTIVYLEPFSENIDTFISYNDKWNQSNIIGWKTAEKTIALAVKQIPTSITDIITLQYTILSQAGNYSGNENYYEWDDKNKKPNL